MGGGVKKQSAFQVAIFPFYFWLFWLFILCSGCGHCKRLAPVYDRVGKAFRSEPNVS